MSETAKEVLFVTYDLDVAGAQTLLVNILNGLDRSKVVPVLVSLGAKNSLERKLNSDIEFHKVVRSWKFDLSPSRLLEEIIKEHEISSIFTLGPSTCLFVRLALRNVPYKVRVHVVFHSTIPRTFYDYVKTFLHHRLLSKDARLIATTVNQARYISKIYLVPYHRYTVIYNGVDVDRFSEIPASFNLKEFREALGISDGSFVIVMVAGFRKEKKHEHAMQALKLLHSRSVAKPYLLCVGDLNIDRKKELEAVAAKIGLAENIKFFDAHTAVDVRPYLWISDLFTLSSVTTETFSIAALEAMATGLPCVLTDIGGAGEMVENGSNGFLVKRNSPEELASAWEDVMNGELGASSGQIIEMVKRKFSLNRCIAAYQALIMSE